VTNVAYPSFPNGSPPNFRVVKSCATCRNTNIEYMADMYGELRCTKFPRVESEVHFQAGVTALPVGGFNLCDAYEECDNVEDRLNSIQ